MHYVYILKCKNKKSYVGCTNDLKKRLSVHRLGRSNYTRKNPPESLVGYFAFVDQYTAYKFESYLKSGSGRAFLKRHIFSGKQKG